MEKLLKVTLDEAKQWYFGNNEILKSLALKVFTEEELTFSADDVYNKTTKVNCNLSGNHFKKFQILDKIAVLADYFNNKSNKTGNNYFIGFYRKSYEILKHNDAMYPGLIYFNRREDAEKVLKVLSDDDLKILKG